MRRALCPVETLYVAQRSRAVLSCALHGHLDTGALSAAFDSVTAEHPTLRARISSDDRGHALELLGEDRQPRLTLRTGDDEAYQEELNTPLPVGGPLARAVLISAPDGRSHTLVLTIDHTITDGHSALTLHNTVWERYGTLVEGTDVPRTTPVPGTPAAARTPPPEQPDWPVPVSELLPYSDEAETTKYLERRIEEAERHRVELVPYDTPRQPPGTVATESARERGTADGHRIEVRRLFLDPERTARLRGLARDADVSVHGLVGAALLLAARARLGGEGPRVLGCMSPIDLRSRLAPPLSPAVMVAAVTSHLQSLPVSEADDPLELAREVGSRLQDSIERGDHFQEMRIMPQVPRHPALQMGTVIVTNMGVVPGPRLPEGLRATDVRLVPAREQYFPQAGRSPLMACVVSLDGRLAVELPHHTACFSPAFMRSLRDDVRSTLLAFAEAGGERSARPNAT
ncbi:protein kinase [Streptomyces sp. NPDC060002]|uniref:phthiocerol/phthiodiolone dimycocerosyl transferase family protein n=1 Tax=Streptomyces sp. NPDC060002 TaxID=3347033 RepID=UPI0036952F57